VSDCGCEMEARNEHERKTLLIVLGINAFMFVFEMTLGLLAQSTGIIADSLDMFADATVYAISLSAIGKSSDLKTKAAKLSGVTQIFLALVVLADVLRRFILGSEPVSALMMGVGVIALLANATCLSLIAKHRNGGIHLRASLIFSKNDVIANIGVIFSGILVWVLGSRYPDLVIGSVIAVVVLRGGLQILKEAAESKDTFT
jgi:cation diffusion facilitator family transporter